MHLKEIHNPLLKDELKTVGTQAADRNGALYTKHDATGAVPSNRHERRAAESQARSAPATHHNTKQMRSKRFG